MRHWHRTDGAEDWHDRDDAFGDVVPAPSWVTWLVVALGAAWCVLAFIGLFTVIGWIYGGA